MTYIATIVTKEASALGDASLASSNIGSAGLIRDVVPKGMSRRVHRSGENLGDVLVDVLHGLVGRSSVAAVETRLCNSEC